MSMVAQTTSNKTAEVAKLLSCANRVKILEILCQQSGSICVSDIAERISLSPSATSHQLAKLSRNGIVKSKREGQCKYYRLNKNSLTEDIREILSCFS